MTTPVTKTASMSKMTTMTTTRKEMEQEKNNNINQEETKQYRIEIKQKDQSDKFAVRKGLIS